jgi:hypothetical protein
MTSGEAQPQKAKVSAEHPAMSDAQIAALAPCLFSSRNYAPGTDELIRQKFLEMYKPFRDQGMNSFDLARIANDGYSPELLNLEPYRREEWQLLNFLADSGIDIHRMFTRYWMGGIFSARGGSQSQKSAIYLPPVQTSVGPPWRGRGITQLDEMILAANTGDILQVANSAPEPRDVVLLLDAERSFGTFKNEGGTALKTQELDLSTIRKCRLPAWHSRSAIPLGRVASEPMRIQVAGSYGQLASQGILLV